MLFLTLGFFTGALAEDNAAKPPTGQNVRVGVYDTRVVAYARFWTAEHQQKLSAMAAEAQAAKNSGDTKKFDEIRKSLQSEQRQIHRQVFSTAPIDDVLQEIAKRLPDIQKQAGVSILISKWDAEKLKSYASVEQIDVTNLLVGEFKPTEKHRKVIEEIKKAKPVPLDRADSIE
jgi:hypothetical protein